MIKKLTIIQPLVFDTQKIDVATDYSIPTLFGNKPIYRSEIINIPNYEKTNILLAETLSNMIKNNAKELGEITSIEIVPSTSRYYEVVVCGVKSSCIDEIEVPQGFGKEVE